MTVLVSLVLVLAIWQSVRTPTVDSISSGWCAKDWSTLPDFTLAHKGQYKPMRVRTWKGVRKMQARATFRFAGMCVTYYSSAKGWAGLRFTRPGILVVTDLLFYRGRYMNFGSFEIVRAVRMRSPEQFALAALLRVVERTYASALEMAAGAVTA